MAVGWPDAEGLKRKEREMAEKTYADKRYYTNADRTKLVPEGSEEAAYLVVAEGSEVTDEMREKYGIKGKAREEVAEEPGIVVSGGRDTGPGFVKAEALADATEGTAGGEESKAPAKTSTKTASKSK